MIRILLFLALGAIIEKSHGEDVPGYIQYLIKYGYLETAREGGPVSFSDRELYSALKTAQKFAGIPQAGILDNATKKMITAPRCGLSDKLMKYSGVISRWYKNQLTYCFLNYSPQFRPQIIENTISEALSKWAEPTGLKFSLETSEMSELKIGFFSGDHNDSQAFDGPNRILAHAAYPMDQDKGMVHFDEDENWTIVASQDVEDFDSYSLLAVAIHELGHALGLQHSYVVGSVMRPHYTTKITLGSDDIRKIKSLYKK